MRPVVAYCEPSTEYGGRGRLCRAGAAGKLPGMAGDGMGDADSHYLHGTAPDEQARLARLNDLLNERALAELALWPGQRVLDVGSGLGQLTRGMARQVGPGRVLGIERSPEQLAAARRLA